MTTATTKPETKDVTPVRCIWSGGGCQIWLLSQRGRDFFRLSRDGQWVGDYSTEAEATSAIAAK